jgi:hypothetical protein
MAVVSGTHRKAILAVAIMTAGGAARAAPEADLVEAIVDCVVVDAQSPHRDNAARMASITAL